MVNKAAGKGTKAKVAALKKVSSKADGDAFRSKSSHLVKVLGDISRTNIIEVRLLHGATSWSTSLSSAINDVGRYAQCTLSTINLSPSLSLSP